MTRTKITALGWLLLVSACGGSEFVSDSGDAGTNGGTGATGGSSAGNSSGGDAGTGGVAGNAGSSSGGSTTGGGAGSAGASGSGGSFNCAEMDCDDDNECTTDSCNASDGCVHEARQGQPCNDGVFCNGEDRCVGTRCEEHLGDPCNGATTVCDEGQDTCVGCINNSDCPDDILGAYSNCMFDMECTVNGTKFRTVTTYTCTAGTCKPSTTTQPADCSRTTNGQPCAADGNPCTSDVCSGGTCTHPTLADGSLCSNETGVASSNALCCGGHCRSTHSDKDNCGGCFVKCGGTPSECQDGYCRTCGLSQTDCDAVHAGMICNLAAEPGRCECNDNSDCPMPWQMCTTQGQCRGVAPSAAMD